MSASSTEFRAIAPIREKTQQILADPAYVARLEAHYRQIKRAAADPHDPAYATIRRLDRDEQRWQASQGRPAARTRRKRRKRK